MGHRLPLPCLQVPRKHLAVLPGKAHDQTMGWFLQRIAVVLAPVVDLVFPPRCPLCGAGLAAQDGLCSACWSDLTIPGEPCCSQCQRPFPSHVTMQNGLCAPCLAMPPQHDGIAAATLYNDASRQLVLAFKHGRKIALAPMMAKQIAARLPQSDDHWLVVPVPLHRVRLWRRGFNQSALLAREIAGIRGGELIVDALVRKKRTPSLGGLGRKARIRALTGAIGTASQWRGRLQGSCIVLVDDVLTSGATSDACVAALKRAGAKKVIVACFARVADESV